MSELSKEQFLDLYGRIDLIWEGFWESQFWYGAELSDGSTILIGEHEPVHKPELELYTDVDNYVTVDVLLNNTKSIVRGIVTDREGNLIHRYDSRKSEK